MGTEEPKVRKMLAEAGIFVLALAVFGLLFYGLTASEGEIETRTGTPTAPVTDSPGDGDPRLAGHEIDTLYIDLDGRTSVELLVHTQNGEVVRVTECISGFRSAMQCETIPLDMVESIYGDLIPPD